MDQTPLVLLIVEKYDKNDIPFVILNKASPNLLKCVAAELFLHMCKNASSATIVPNMIISTSFKKTKTWSACLKLYLDEMPFLKGHTHTRTCAHTHMVRLYMLSSPHVWHKCSNFFQRHYAPRCPHHQLSLYSYFSMLCVFTQHFRYLWFISSHFFQLIFFIPGRMAKFLPGQSECCTKTSCPVCEKRMFQEAH